MAIQKVGTKSSKKTTTTQADSVTSGSHRILVTGEVVSNKMQKTIVVKVSRKVKHSRYGKFITVSQKVKAHDEKNDAQMGDLVELIESRPLSKEKRWALRKIVRRNEITQAIEETV